MTVEQRHVTVNFVHPTESSKVLTAIVGETATPRFLIDQMIQGAFLARPDTGAEYKLVDTATGTELVDHVTLAVANVAPNTTLSVLHSVTGASMLGEPDESA
jgi:hypothetical protein